jgi:hypothetical protein
MKFNIPPQTEAEQDQYLIECFHDANFIEELLSHNFTIVTGRKGTGKTALAKFLKEKYKNWGIDFAYRLSVDEFTGQFNGKFESVAEQMPEIILFYILTRTTQLLLENGHFNKKNSEYWNNFLMENGLQDINEYKAFVEWASTHEAEVDFKIFDGKNTKERRKTTISNTTGNLFNSLYKSLLPKKKVLIFIDDLTDYLDRTDKNRLTQEISIVRDILLRLDKYNSTLVTENKNLSFICCIRDDLWGHMEGSNINKLKNNSLKLRWDEKSFCSLLIRRLPFFQSDQKKSLENPEAAITEQFPNEIFRKILAESGTKKFKTNFYAYMMAVSFNRPRDFLKFCYAMRARLSEKHPVEIQNIESAEVEYSDYFIGEIKDELFLLSKVIGFKDDLENIKKLIHLLSKKESFGYGELRTEIAKYLENPSHCNVFRFIKELWWYGILGFRSGGSGVINFNYMSEKLDFPVETDVKSYDFFLHKGLLWSMRKDKQK